MAVMTKLDLGISAVWHISGFLHPRVMRNCFQIIVFASVHSVSLNQSPLTPVCLGLNHNLHSEIIDRLNLPSKL